MDRFNLTDAEFLELLESNGCALRPSGGKLRCVVPGGEGLDETLRSEIASRRDALLAIVHDRSLPLSYEQERLWFLNEYGGESGSPYHMPAAFRIKGELDTTAMKKSLAMLVERHESLRTIFRSEHGRPYQEIGPPWTVTLDEEPVEESALAGALAAKAVKPFDLAKGPLTRFRLFRLGEDDRVLMVCQHHIIGDGWSTGILLDDLGRFYSDLVGGLHPDVSPPALEYADYALWQRTDHWAERARAGEDYWREKLDGIEELELLPDFKRPPVRTTDGKRVAFDIDGETARRVREISEAEGCTPFMVLLTAFKALLQRLSGQDDIAVGTPVANRGSPDLEGTVGFFVNTLVLRTGLEGDPTFMEALGRVRRTCLDAYEHQDLPFVRLVDLMQAGRYPSRSPLFNIMFVLRHLGGEESLNLPGCTVTAMPVTYDTAKFDLAFELNESPGKLAGEIEYNTDLYTAETAGRVAACFEKMLRECCRDLETRPGDVEILDEVEKEEILSGFNATGAPFPTSTLHALFREQARLTPESIALVSGDEKMTYEELDRTSDAAAARLVSALGDYSPTDTIVGLPAIPEPGTIVRLLGILKAGCAYLPLDPSYPPERLAFMLEDSGAKALLAGGQVPGNLAEALSVLRSRGNDIPVEETTAEPVGTVPREDGDPRSLAYLIYTSGSTGEPKGVLVEHLGVSNLVVAQRRVFGIDASSKVLQFAPLGFDASASEIFTALLSGAELHLVGVDVRQDADRLVELIEESGITTATLPPALLAVLPHKRLPALETLVVAGDRCDEETMRRWSSGRRLVNAYGPTEATVCASMHVWREEDSPVNIGRPMNNVRLYVLDEQMRPPPLGIPGSLFIGGAGLARGYLNRPGLNKEAFVDNPFSPEAGSGASRLYKTGDRARWLAGGELEFLGRIDDQVKVRGFRVEPGEIESALRRHSAVVECVVTPVREGGMTRLAAYWVPADVSEEVGPSALREFLGSKLPSYMVPSWFIPVDTLPFTTSGKVDRKALPAFDARAIAGAGDGEAPRTPTEKKLAAIWEQVLKVERVGVEDNFFSLGGDSIMSIQVVSRAREAGLELKPRDLFTCPTVSALAARASRATRRRSHARRAKGEALLTPIQSWFFELDMPDMNHFNQSVLVELDQVVYPDTLREALKRLAGRHDSLRLRFEKDADGRWRQSYCREAAAINIPVREIDLSGRADELELECEKLQASMDITEGPVAVAAIFTGLPDSRQRMLLAVHHIIVDAVSWQVLLEDLTHIYTRLREGRTVRFASRRGSSYQEWGEALRRYLDEKAEAQLDYWLDVVNSAPRMRWEQEGGAARNGELLRYRVRLDPGRTSDLVTRAASAYHAGARDLLVAALMLAWHKVFGERALLLDLEGHGRESIDEDVDVTRTVGWFTSLYPVLLRMPSHTSKDDGKFPGALIKAVKEDLHAAPDGGLGYGVLRYMGRGTGAKELRESAGAGVVFNYLGRIDAQLPGRLAGEIDRETTTGEISDLNPAVHPLEINAFISNGRLEAEFAASPRHLGAETAGMLADVFEESLVELVEHCLETGSGGYTPSDFPLASLDQGQLDAIVGVEETEDIYYLSPMQEGLLFHALYAPGSDQYVEQLCWKYTGRLDAAALKKAWEQIVARHAVFRTACFHEGLERPVQVVRKNVAFDWRESDWREVPASAIPGKLEEYIRDDRSEGFDLSDAGLIRFHLIRTCENEHEFVWCFHHILIDGWCSSVLLDELRLRYQALTGGASFKLPAPPPFRDFLAWLGERDAEADEEFWRGRLEGVDEPTPLGMNRRSLEIHKPIELVDEANVRLTERMSSKVAAFAREHRVTVNSVLQTAWAMVLGLYSDRGDVVLGVNVSGRPGEIVGVEKMVGLFVNAVPVRFRLDADGSGLDAVLSMHSEMQAVNEHCYGSLAEVQRFSKVPSGTPLFFSEYVFENYPMDETILEGMPGLSISDFRAVEKTNYPLGLMAAPGPPLSVKALYDVGSFSRGSIERMLGHIRTAIEWIVENGSSPLKDAVLMPPEEREAVARRWSGAEVPVPQAGPSVMELFSERASRKPDSPAIHCEGERLTYGELLGLSDRIAGELACLLPEREAGNPAVGLLVSRRPLAVAAIIGINSVGSAFVPMDPEHPDERLRFMIEDAGLDALLTEEKYIARLRELVTDTERTRLVSLENISGAAGGERARASRPDEIACVIYTSGSTGTPKGVAITNCNLADHIAAAADRLGVTADDVVLQFSTLAFDASLEQIFTALLAGAEIVMRGDALWTPEELRDVLLREGVTVMNLPTGYWRETAKGWAEDPGDLAESRLRLVLPGGDVMDADTVQVWRRLPLPPHTLLNMYGPTETTITSTICEVPEHLDGPVPIGRPVGARRLYVLGKGGRLKPPGIPGELHIGGIGVSPGYLNRPEETAARFLEDPFASGEEKALGYGRIYKTGDLARWREDGELEFLGRADFQAKLRGFRVEPEEIEAFLGSYPAMADCAVVAVGEGNEKELVAYCVPGTDSEETTVAAANAVSEWEQVYEELFGRAPVGDFDTTGWDSSYDGRPIPPEQMREWVDETVARILELNPRSVVEIGCGTGLILTRVAPHCRSYLGVDFSRHAIDRLRERLAREPVDGAKVLRGRAEDIGRLVSGQGLEPDTVIINSVAQYFPGLEYLEDVLEQALEAVGDGTIFIGDVRDLRLQDAFHLSVEMAKAGGVPEGDLHSMLVRDALNEKELLVSPWYFLRFAQEHERVTDVRVMAKQGRFSNEMNDYRYDVLLKAEGGAPAGGDERAWEPGLDLERLLSEEDDLVTVGGYPNRKTWVSYGLSLLVDKGTDLDEEADALEREAGSFLSIEQLESLAAEHDYALYPRLSLQDENAPASYDLIFSRESAPAGKPVKVRPGETWYANNPLARGTRARMDVEDLRDFLSARLPGYMVPARFVELDAIPRTPTGKPDRRALEGFKGAGIAPQGYAPPRDEYEALLADILADVLRLDRVGVEDDFFRLGGHSLSATRVASRIKRVFDVHCPVKSIFEHPTVSELASFIRSGLSPASRVTPPLVHSERTGYPPLSFAQERLWFLDRFEPVSNTSYKMPSAFRFTGPLDVPALETSFKLLFERHESLRTVFADEGGEPFQVIGGSPFELDVEDVAADRLRDKIHSLVHLPFDLEAGPLARVHLLRVDGEDHVLLINQHHIISDAWSVGVLLEELSACYAEFAAGREPELDPIAVTYVDYAIWQKSWLAGEVLRDELDHWRGKLEGAKRLELPVDRPRGERAVRRGKQFSFRLDEDVTARLKRTSREAGASLYMLLLGVFSLLLARTCGEDDVLLGTVTAGRTEEALEKVLGFFVNTLLLRIDLSGDPTFAELLERVRETALDAFAHEEVPFEKLVAELHPERGRGSTPLLSAMLVYQNVPGADLELEGLGVSPVGVELGAVRSDLDLYAWEEGGALELCLVYDADLFDDRTIATMAARLERIASLVSKDARSSLSAVSQIEPAVVSGPALPSPLPAGKSFLSFHQERLWFIDRFEEGTVYDSKPVYHNMPLVIAFDGPVDEQLLKASLAKVVERYAALRTHIETAGDGAWQSVGRAAGILLERVDVERGGEARLKEAALTFAGRPFTDEEEPRVRAALVRGESSSLFVLAVHHILADSRSLEIIAKELSDLYGASTETAADEKLPYPAFSEWQRNVPDSGWEPLLYYWRWRMRGDIPALALPEDRPRPAIHTYTAGVHGFPVGGELAARLEDLARHERADVESVLLAGLMLTLLCFSGQDELVVGMFGDGRPPGAEEEVGPFDNLLAIRGRQSAGLTCRGFIKSIQETLAEARTHAALPFDLLVENLNPPLDMSRTALFDVLFCFREGRRDLRFGETRARVIENNLGLGKYDLNLVFTSDEGDIDGIATFNADIYEKANIAGMMSRYLTVLENMVSSPDSILGDFSLLSEEEEELIDCWNETAARCPETATLDGLFAEQARKTPDRVAVTFKDRNVTYSELDAEANRLARYLKESGVGRDNLVALCLDRSVESVTAMLAVLKAGGAYLPIEASFPPERIAFLLEDSGADVIVTTSEMPDKLPGRPPHVVLLDADAETIASMPDDGPPASATPADLAYCIYTSGSTGRPKGVLVEHRNVVRLLVNERMPFDFSQEDIWTMFHSYAFDFSVWEMYGALLSGGRLVIVPSETTRDFSLLLDLINREGVTVLNQVPSAFYSLSREAADRGSAGTHLRYVIFGGEALDYSMLGGWREVFPSVRLVNMYGITETCVHVTFKEVRDEDIAAGIGNIGRPLPDTTVTIVDGLMRPLPPGIAGEICVGGGGVARGYLGRDELTAEKFVPDARRPSGKLYRSGDLGRFLPDGEIEYLGRIDDQVQVRGFRVEPGEIENRLAGHPGVERAAVRVWERKSEGASAGGRDLFFAAYYRPSLGPGAKPQPGPEELKAFLAETLPSYMVPSYVVGMDEMPLTPGGKVDRGRLPDPRTAGRAGVGMLGPRDPVELRLKEIWEEVIGGTISIGEDFFLAGGHSLLAVRLVSRINAAFGTSHAVSWAFLNRTVEEQARALREEGRSPGFRPLVTFNGKGDRTPIYFVHPGQAGAEAYSGLASLLGDDIPFHAVESRNLFDLGRPMLATVESLAESYMEAILPVCGLGPCILGGWSFGGTVAFEIARRMLAHGVEVETLVMLDAIRYDEEERELVRELARAGETDALLEREALYRDFPETYRDRLVEVMRLEFEAMVAYGSGEYPGLAVLLKPTEEQPAAPLGGAAAAMIAELTARLAPKADNGWSADIADLEVRQVTGNHLTMMEGRGLKEIAQILSGTRSKYKGNRGGL